jgi:predicted ATPase
MRISNLRFREFKRFTDLSIDGLPPTAKLVVLIGPNGSGKTSLFEAMNYHSRWNAGKGEQPERAYHIKEATQIGDNSSWTDLINKLQITLHEPPQTRDEWKKAFYFRTAYRHEANFAATTIGEVGDALDDRRQPRRLLDVEIRVSDNYQRIVGLAINEVFNTEGATQTAAAIRERLIGKVRRAMENVFGNLILQGVGNPFVNGTFLFEKGESQGYQYVNLSGGEKAAFDLLLDFIVKTEFFDDTVYCIDEPELHMHTRLQGRLLDELFQAVPERCQLWIATHSIGMMKRAMELHQRNPDEVVFIDFENQDFDKPVVITPTQPGRMLWKRVFAVALDDLAGLMAPSLVILCEGKPIHQTTQKAPTFDAEVYRTIFQGTKPNAEFIPLGGSNDVETDSIPIGRIFTEIFDGIKVWRLIDRDDRSDDDIQNYNRRGISVLNRRDIESYLWDDEILTKLCLAEGRPDVTDTVLSAKNDLLAGLGAQQKPADDVKSIKGLLYGIVKRDLAIVQRGNTADAFAKQVLAPLITPDTAVYQALEAEIFGPIN